MGKVTKEELVQELQSRNVEFDGSATVKDLTALLKDSQARDTEVNAPGSTDNSDKANDVVKPIESVAVSAPIHDHERCWNCYAQDKKTRNFLDKDGNCPVCGFKKDDLYNGNIEADKAAQRVELAKI